ncbi:hypothetical protein CHS0354_029885 [Potamilus streckersoni]|uniref:Major facilitator superfamily (MFS) profile domain-containing protein n=1 Tax=Potamilus streckersoni TaxID=2493646 RepID=A0AAE0VIN1_9BIVA|nr:hypothetical protein CHS0354_029885 [Potamilus streckersoni]
MMIISDSEEEFELDTVSMSDERTLLVNNALEADRLEKMERRVQYTSEDDNVIMESESDSKPETRRTPCFVYTLSFFSAIGGFLFGYDTGVVSGAMLLLKDYFNLLSLQEEIIVSVTIGFAFLFALVGGFLNDFFGRKATTLIASVVFTAGAFVLAFAKNVAMLIIGRSILGIGIGTGMLDVSRYSK